MLQNWTDTLANNRKAGVTERELSEALSTAIALNAGAAYVYSLRAMDALAAGQV